MLFRSITSAALLALYPLALAQTYTNCSPLNSTCPPNLGLGSTTFREDFTTQDFTNWSLSSTTLITRNSNGVQFQIVADAQDPTLSSDFYIFFGRIDVTMQAAPGVGIVSAIVLESDDLDEIDFEFVGGDTTHAQSNFYGKGNVTTYDRGAYHPVSSPETTFHTYSINWTSELIQWIIDGTVVRQVAYSDALALGGAGYPQTPSRVRLGNWVAGGAKNSNGTVQWAGGKVDFSQAPFNMYVKSITITNYNPALSYTYGDHSGSYQSIQKGNAVPGNSVPGNAVSGISAASSSASTAITSSTTMLTSSITMLTSSTTMLSSSSTMLSSSTTTVVSSTHTQPPLNGTGIVPGYSTVSSMASTATNSVVSTSTATSGLGSSSKTSSTSSSTSSAPAVSTGGSDSSLGASTSGLVLGLAAVFCLL